MSLSLLRGLAGPSHGVFKRWIDSFEGEPRIAWYPSAGEDFRDLLYLSPEYSRLNPANGIEPDAPDIFIHSDYFPWDSSEFLDSRKLHLDDNTSITLKAIEELPSCVLPLDPEVVDSPEGSVATGRVLFLEIEVKSEKLGQYTRPVLYVFSENGAFCAERIIPEGGWLSHIVHVRFGGGLGGGGKSAGGWLLHILRKVRCELFISDENLATSKGDERILNRYPILKELGSPPHFEGIRTIPSTSWSSYGDVTWNKIKEGN